MFNKELISQIFYKIVTLLYLLSNESYGLMVSVCDNYKMTLNILKLSLLNDEKSNYLLVFDLLERILDEWKESFENETLLEETLKFLSKFISGEKNELNKLPFKFLEDFLEKVENKDNEVKIDNWLTNFGVDLDTIRELRDSFDDEY